MVPKPTLDQTSSHDRQESAQESQKLEWKGLQIIPYACVHEILQLSLTNKQLHYLVGWFESKYETISKLGELSSSNPMMLRWAKLTSCQNDNCPEKWFQGSWTHLAYDI